MHDDYHRWRYSLIGHQLGDSNIRGQIAYHQLVIIAHRDIFVYTKSQLADH